MRVRVKLQSDIGSLVCMPRWRDDRLESIVEFFGAVDQKLFTCYARVSRRLTAFGFRSGCCGVERQWSFGGFGLWFCLQNGPFLTTEAMIPWAKWERMTGVDDTR